ncbi:MAG: hypothetical protein JRJ49_08680 [Deltaproteobacteria bacterium]|nr:hypothetical protein [Deltaproteobacteria bacterium]
MYPSNTFLHGLYNTDKVRSLLERAKTKHQFSGRDRISYDIRLIYKEWAKLLRAEDLSMRLLSGLHAHIVVFMAIGDIGDKILLLHEKAGGGHMSTKNILERLGYQIIEMSIDYNNRRINIEETKKIIREKKSHFIFVDRSEGINYEDFSDLIKNTNCYSIFDASQYLANIMANEFKSPFILRPKNWTVKRRYAQIGSKRIKQQGG